MKKDFLTTLEGYLHAFKAHWVALADFYKTHPWEFLDHLREHVVLVAGALGIALLIGIPLGILSSRKRFWRRIFLPMVNVFQTIPSLALFGFLLPVPWIGGLGARSALTALVCYSLLPVVRSVLTGIEEVPGTLRTSADALGMTSWQRLWRVELPLAMPVLFSGIRVASVLCIGLTTIASAIGAGGLGVYIFQGLQSNNAVRIWAGALPAALLAFVLDLLLGLCARFFKKPLFYKAWRWFWFTGKGWIWGALVLLLATGGFWLFSYVRRTAPPIQPLVIGSKNFSEQSLLNELLTQLLREQGVPVRQVLDLRGTLCHQALLEGTVDLYPEYTSTAALDLLKLPFSSDAAVTYQRISEAYRDKHILVSPTLGFRDDFVLLMRKEQADALHIKNLSDVQPYAPTLRLGMGHDFRVRSDGYAGFIKAYNLAFAKVDEMDLNAIYGALANRSTQEPIHVGVGNTTDGRIQSNNLIGLIDDRHYFAPYEVVFLVRENATVRFPQLWPTLRKIAGRISTAEMTQLNTEVDAKKRDVAEVIREFRQRKGW